MRATSVVLSAAAIALLGIGSSWDPGQPEGRSCFTFVLQRGETHLVGHNLDESIAVPGLVVANPRGLAKRNVSYGDLSLLGGRSGSASRLAWTARYASLTYNTFGREFPDGGFNEAGLYVGEMTLLATEWPKGGTQARFYHNQWMQYLLDNFATVEEALASLAGTLPEGHCKWHFLLADKGGDAAVVEFLKGKPVVYRGSGLPYPILGNDAYQPELDDIRNYAGFGGAKDPKPHYEREDPRFRWAAVMLREDNAAVPAVDHAFAILKRVDLASTPWSVVCDLISGKLYFRTNLAPRVRWADLSAFDGACTDTPPALDIHRDLEGDVSKRFAPLTAEANRQAVQAAWKTIDAGFLGNLFFKPGKARDIAKAAEGFGCGR